jgi:hypothetical protein
MKLILQIAAGVFLAQLAMQGVHLVEDAAIFTAAVKAMPTFHEISPPLPQYTTAPVPPYKPPPRQVQLPYATPRPANETPRPLAQITPLVQHEIPREQLDCRTEEINGKTYECCLESPKDPSIRSCTATQTH